MHLKGSVNRIFLSSRLNPNPYEVLKNERDVFYGMLFFEDTAK